MSIKIKVNSPSCIGVSSSKAIYYYLGKFSAFSEPLGNILATVHQHGSVSVAFQKEIAQELAQITMQNYEQENLYEVASNLQFELNSVLDHYSKIHFISPFTEQDLTCFETMEVSA